MSVDLDALFAHHHAQFRDPRQIVSQWTAADAIAPGTFDSRVTGHWWDILDELGITLLVTREYEHLVHAFSAEGRKKHATYLPMPHPNGLAVDPTTHRVHIASTRNPNVIFDLAPCTGSVVGRDDHEQRGTLVPTQSRYYPGCLYIHDIALIAGDLYANAVGLNAIVRLGEAGQFEPVWWPKCIDSKSGPRFDKNYLQLNSIAAGPTLERSFFGASAAAPSGRRPGHKNFPVDGRGVIFSGQTRDVCGVGLTRPHSARLRGQELWVDNSGYGEVGRIVDGRFDSFARLPGWTRGLCFHGDYLFVGTSRVLSKYAHYAPGLDADQCIAGIHILDLSTGKTLGSLTWAQGNQLFAIESLPRSVTRGLPFAIPSRGRSGKSTNHFFGVGTAA